MCNSRFTAILLAPALTLAVEVELTPTPGPERTDDAVAESVIDAKPAAKKPENELVVVPNPSYSPTFGGMLTLMGLYAYRPDGVTGKPWTLGAFAFGTQNESWGLGVFNDARPGDDSWRIQTAAAYIDARYQFYGSGPDSPLLDNPVDLRQRIALVSAAVLRRISESMYLGPVLSWRGIRTSPTEETAEDLVIDQGIVGIGVKFLYDSRDTQFAPTSGINAKVRAVEAFANTSELGPLAFDQIRYQRIEAGLNHYQSLRPDLVLASRVATQWASDDAPFYELPFLGKGADLRGYSGEFRDHVLAAMQVELRQTLPWRFGITAFAGIGAVAPTYAGLPDATARPSLGGSISYQVAPSNRINARFDAAWGSEGWTFYFAIGDAF